MARTSDKDSTAETTETTAEQTGEASLAPPCTRAFPIVIKLRGNKKKRKYTRGTKDVQRLERGVTKASRRLSRAVASGFATYEKKRNKSSRKKRDGAIRDAIENWTRAYGRAIRKGSDAPYDVAKALNTKRLSRPIRDAIRLVTPPLFR